MKEKIRKLFDEMKVRSRYKSMSDIINMIEPIVNQEVEKRIAETVAGKFIAVEIEKRIKERVPSEMTLEKAEIAAKETDYACFAVEPEGNEINFADAAAFYLEGWNACRSRLTRKTEGGGE